MTPEQFIAALVAALKDRDSELYQVLDKHIVNSCRVRIAKEGEAGHIVSDADLAQAIDEETYTSPGLYHRVRESSFEGAREALRQVFGK